MTFSSFRPVTCSLALVVIVAGVGCGDYNDNQTQSRQTTPEASSISPQQSSKRESLKVLAEFESRFESDHGRFTDLSVQRTGIDYPHVWKPRDIFRNLIVGTFGNGVAIGDYDGDGWQDVFIGRQHEAGRLYKNLSGMKFKDVTHEVGIDPAGMWCVGTTFADINNDGLLDLYLCGYECPNRLYINQGGHFQESAADYGLDFKGSSVVMNFADYDRDGDLDGYLVTNLKKLQKKKKSKQQIIRRPGRPPEVTPEYRETVFLIEHPDGTYRKSRAGQFDYFFRNDGGKFVDATEEVGIGMQPYMGLSSAWWDFNDDGWPDLYVANDFKGPDLLYRNNGPNEAGKVTFTEVSQESLPHTPWYSMGSDFADIDNDGRLDYLASDMAGTNHYRDKLSMGSMSGPGSNGWFLNAPNPPQYMRNALYLNTGRERFAEIAYLTGLAKTDWTWTVKFADFDNDGWQDIFFTNGMTRDLFNSDLRNEIDERVRAAQGEDRTKINRMVMDFWEGQEPYRLENMAYRNVGDYKFIDVGEQWGLDHFGVSMAAAVGDLDNDGDIDLVVNGFEEQVKIFRNDLKNEKSIRFKLKGTKSNRFGTGARIELFCDENDPQVRQTRFASPTRGFMSTCEDIIHFGVGQRDSIARVSIRWPSGVRQDYSNLITNRLYEITEPESTTPDTPKDSIQKPPMFVESESKLSGFKHEELGFDDFKRQPLLPNKHSQLGPGLAWGDVDGDGFDDLFLGGAKGAVGRILRGSSSGNFQESVVAAFDSDKESEDMAALFFDVDSDNDLDLYVVSGGVECDPQDAVLQDRLYLNDGTGAFEKSTDWLPEINESGSAVAASDYDKDGDLDLVIGGRIVPGKYPESPSSFLLENSDDRFEIVTGKKAPQFKQCGMVNSLIWSDVDGDDWTDLLVATEWGPVRVFKNDSGRLVETTEESGLSEYFGWFNSICAGDIDNDGDTDFVVGNVGLNTKYKASFEKPELLFYGDFEGVGRKRIVEAKYENDICLPRRGLSCSSHAMPMIKEKTPTYHEFAMSSLDSLYTEEKLDQATRFQANTLDSLILINESTQDQIKFRVTQLPRLAQASPIFGCQLVDVDGDGNVDLYVAQNFYGPQRETGYFDGGVSLLMMGNGDGEFYAVDALTSGLVVSGDATSLTIVDLNRDLKPDFVVGRNNATLKCFTNQSSDNSHFVVDFSHRIRNGKRLLGTKVRAKYSDESTQLLEMRSCQGYLSQSTPMLFIGNGGPGKVLQRVDLQFPDGDVMQVKPESESGKPYPIQ